ncbi:MAG: hypothetical protein JNM93_07760 [Bacteriovoracaceae bacterium]|nr:hypothetical protein [Bacteriovoracaceae bacterium]
MLFNGKQKDNSHFLYNLAKDDNKVLITHLRDKIAEFMEWYGQFKNRTPIKTFDLYSHDFACSKNCKIDLSTKFNLIGMLYTDDEVTKILEEEAERFQIPLELNKRKT